MKTGMNVVFINRVLEKGERKGCFHPGLGKVRKLAVYIHIYGCFLFHVLSTAYLQQTVHRQYACDYAEFHANMYDRAECYTGDHAEVYACGHAEFYACDHAELYAWDHADLYLCM